MSRNLSVVEPHPSVVSGGYIGSGRGGAGNYKHYKRSDLSDGATATGPPARTNIPKPSKRVFLGGRGGAGNAITPNRQSEEAIFQFDEEMLKRRESVAPTYHIGRGGAANWVDESKPRTERMGSTDSSASTHSGASTSSSVRRSMGDALGRWSKRLSRE